MKKQTERIVFIVALVSGVLSLYLNYTLLPVLLAFSCLTYLALGWQLLNPEKGNKFNFVYFWIGYSFSTVFLTMIFDYYTWPLVKEFQYVAISMLIISIIMMSSIRRIREKGVVEQIIKTVLVIGLVAWSLVR